MKLDPDDSFIPAIPWNDGPKRPDPTARDRVATATTSPCSALRERGMYTEFNRESGELRLTVYDGYIDREEFNRVLAGVRQQFDVKAIVVYVLNDDGVGEEAGTTLAVARLGINTASGDKRHELIRQLVWQKYERQLARESETNQKGRETGTYVCYRLFPATQWMF